MSNRWMAFVLFGLGMAAGPMVFHFGDTLIKPAGAEDKIFVQQNVKVQGGEVQSTPAAYSLDLIGLDLMGFDRRKLVPLQQRKIHTGENTASDGKVNFTESVKILNGVFNFNVTSPASNTSEILNSAGINPIGVGVAVPGLYQYTQPGQREPVYIQSGQLVRIGDSADYRPATPGISLGSNDGCEGDVAVNLVGVSGVITSGGTITFDGGTGYGIVLTASTIENAEVLPCTEEECVPNLTARFIELSQEVAKRKLQRFSPRELAQKIEELEQELANDEASSKLDEARKHLKNLISKHSNSPAAQSAKRMLDADQAMPGAPVLQPTPDNLLPTY